MKGPNRKKHVAMDGDGEALAKKRSKVTFKSREFVDTEDEDGEVSPSDHATHEGRGEVKTETPEAREDLEELTKAQKVGKLTSARRRHL